MYRTTASTVCLLCCAGAAFGGATVVAVALTFTCLAAVDILAEEPILRVLESCITDIVDMLVMLRVEMLSWRRTDQNV